MNIGYCSFIVKGQGINFKEIEQNLEIEATNMYKSGESINDLIDENEVDQFRFDKVITDKCIPNAVLNNLITQLLEYDHYIDQMKEKHDIFIKFFLQSNEAQANYRVSSEIMRKISLLDVDFEVSLIS